MSMDIVDISRRESTTVSAGVKKFMTFANLATSSDDNKELSSLEDLSREFVGSKLTWQGFAGFLKCLALRGDITKNTGEVYLNAAKYASRNLFKEHMIFIDNEENKLWQATLILKEWLMRLKLHVLIRV
jgi:hypothetical protein